jgi:hypothetical protein
MRLLIRRQKLHKAGKEGLIAVQKQVTKKGKTFTQTFYVKPEAVPSAPTKPSSAVMNLSEPREKITIHRGGKPYEFESNRPEGGFFIQVGAVMTTYGQRIMDSVNLLLVLELVALWIILQKLKFLEKLK